MVIINTKMPSKDGVYVAYVNNGISKFPKKLLLSFINGSWGYLGSDLKFRGIIYGHIGPLPSPKIEDLKPKINIKYAIGILPDGLHGCFLSGPFDKVKEIFSIIGQKGKYIFKLHRNKEVEVIGKWNSRDNKWVRRKNKA